MITLLLPFNVFLNHRQCCTYGWPDARSTLEFGVAYTTKVLLPGGGCILQFIGHCAILRPWHGPC